MKSNEFEIKNNHLIMSQLIRKEMKKNQYNKMNQFKTFYKNL